nr:nucleic acid binding protein [Cowpea mild mottle virus]
MLGYKRVAILVSLCANKNGFELPFELCVLIALKSEPSMVGQGRSSYARKRRARSIGRCHRCYRVNPKFYFTKKCDGVTCMPGISYNMLVKDFIKFGIKGSN